ncbi:MAG: SIS domain-containing protein [Bacteroidetes bacterium]|nr:SIS domain-containing protein [Bacteroidota bacterium]
MLKKDFLVASLNESAQTKLDMIEACGDDILAAITLFVESFKNGKKLLLCGNGGSAADCQHLATEFMIRLNHELNRPAIPAIALTTDTSNLTAGGNDIGFENVFARNVEGLGNTGDLLMAVSTSGNSGNVLKAVEKAKEKGMKVVGFLGGTGGKLKSMVDVAIVIPSNNVQRIQEGHITAGHIIFELTELELYSGKIKG